MDINCLFLFLDTRSHRDLDADSITSTSVSLDDSYYDNSVIYTALHDTDTFTSPSSTGTDDPGAENKNTKPVCTTDTKHVNQSANTSDIKGEELSDSELEDGEICDISDCLGTSVDKEDTEDAEQETSEHSKPRSDELETMKKQGAIPKHFNKPLPPLPETAPKSQSKEGIMFFILYKIINFVSTCY